MKWIDHIKKSLNNLQPQQTPADWAAMEALLNNLPPAPPVGNKILLWHKVLVVFGVMATISSTIWWMLQTPTADKAANQITTPISILQNDPTHPTAQPHSTTKSKSTIKENADFQTVEAVTANKITAPETVANAPSQKNKAPQKATRHVAWTATKPSQHAIAAALENPEWAHQSETEWASNRPISLMHVPDKFFGLQPAILNKLNIENQIIVPFAVWKRAQLHNINWGLYGAAGWGKDPEVEGIQNSFGHEWGILVSRGAWHLEIGWGQQWHQSTTIQNFDAQLMGGEMVYQSMQIDSAWQILGIYQGAYSYDTTALLQRDSFQVALAVSPQTIQNVVRSWHIPVRVGYFRSIRRVGFGVMAGAVFNKYQFQPTQFGEFQATAQSTTLWQFQIVPELRYRLHPNWAVMAQADLRRGTQTFTSYRLGFRYLF